MVRAEWGARVIQFMSAYVYARVIVTLRTSSEDCFELTLIIIGYARVEITSLIFFRQRPSLRHESPPPAGGGGGGGGGGAKMSNCEHSFLIAANT